MIDFIVRKLRGLWVVGAVAAMGAVGAVVTVLLPYWARINQAQGGIDLQAKLHYRAADVVEAIGAIERADVRADAFIFYMLDVPFAVAYGLGFAGLIAFGVRRLGWSASPARWFVAAPLFSAFADLLEDASLAASLAGGPTVAMLVGDAAGIFTTAKFAALFASQALALVLSAMGLFVWLRAGRPKND